jgi:hypothetical protein
MKMPLACTMGFLVGLAPASVAARDVAYRAPGECPSRDAVRSQIDARAPEGRPAMIDVVKDGPRFRGEVVLGEGARRLQRSVEGKTCGAVVDALSLVVALDRTDATPSEPEDPPEPPTTSPTASPSPAAADAPQRAEAVSSPPATEPVRYTAGLSFHGTSFTSDAAFIGGALFADVAAKSGLFGERALTPSARLSVGTTVPLVHSGGTGTQKFVLTTAALDLCPVGVPAAGTIAFAACARTEIGSLTARIGGDDDASTSRLWAALAGIMRVRWAFGSGDLRPAIELSAGLVRPLIRDRFHFAANATDEVHTRTAAPWSWTIALGTGVAFR